MANLEKAKETIEYEPTFFCFTNRRHLLMLQEMKLNVASSINIRPKYVTEDQRPDKTPNSEIEIVNSNIVTIDDIINFGGNILANKFFICRIISPCINTISIDAIVEDAEGKNAICLTMYNTTPYLRLKLVLGRVLAIKNPWLKTTRKGGFTLCVDDPSDIIHDVSILNKLNVEWKGEIPAKYCTLKMVASSNDDYKKLGNTEFVKKDYTKARHFYSEGLAKYPNDINLLSNRAATFLHLRLFSLALSDAELVLSMQENHSKAIYRKTKALCALGNYAEAQSFITEKINYAKEDKIKLEGLGELEKLKIHVEKLINQSKTGEFDIMEFLKICDAEYFDVAEYTSEIEVIPIKGKGRGIVARKDFSPGELIMASRACIVYLNDTTVETSELFTFADDGLLSRLIQRFVDEPEQVANIYNLYAGPNFERLATGEVNIDIRRLRAICKKNCFVSIRAVVKKKRGLWILPSFLNHSCVDYNADWKIFGDMIFIRAIHFIAKNEEIVIPYTFFEDFETKNVYFKNALFQCNCKLCQAEKAVGQTVLKRADEIGKKGLQLCTVNEVRRAIEELEEVTGNNKMLNMVHEKLYQRLVWLCMESENYEGFLMISKKLYDDVVHINSKAKALRNIYSLIPIGIVPCNFPFEKCTQEMENTLRILFGPSNVSKLMEMSENELTEIWNLLP